MFFTSQKSLLGPVKCMNTRSVGLGWFLHPAIFLLISLSFNVKAQDPVSGEADVPTVEVKYVRDPQRMSYRDAYITAASFQKYSEPKDLIRLTFSLWPLDRSTSDEGLKARVLSESINQELKMEFHNEAVIPLIDKAFAEDAEIEVNRPAGKIGFSNSVSIKVREDGKYPILSLKAACLQQISFLRAVNIRNKLKYSGKKCVGVSFLFQESDQFGAIKVVSANGETQYPKYIGLNDRFRRTYSMSFSIAQDDAMIVSRGTPVAINGRFE
jgi:hypothetical protein